MTGPDTLRSLAIEQAFLERGTSRGVLKLEALKIHFTPGNPPRLTDLSVAATYRSKPLVSINSELLFGELAILRCLQRDGWDGVWVDTFHSRGLGKIFWSDMPPAGRAELPPHAEDLYDRIVAENGGKSSGFFDVFAWKDGDYAFVEYKGEGDSANQNELKWIEASLAAGIEPEQLFFVTY